jgi:orotate phosphoribosyltransferase
MNPAHRQRLLDLINQRAVVRKTVTLASGQTSPYYLDGRMVFLHGESARLIGDAFYHATQDLSIDAVGGPEVGALPLTVATTMRYHEAGRSVEGFFVRKETKTHGLQKRIEGALQPGWRVAVVEDVMTTGGSAVSAIDAIREAGANIVCVLCLVDRQQGAAERFAGMGLNFRSIFTLKELTI